MTLPVRRVTSEPERRSVFDPFYEFDRLSRQMFDLFDRMWRQPIWSEAGFVPAADLEETDKEFVVEVELPGVKREDIDIELAGRRLTVIGERKEKERTGVLRRRTRTVGRFHFEVVFPAEVSEDNVEAVYADGVLTITVPKAEAERARKIPLK